jgi:hypothetical protein
LESLLETITRGSHSSCCTILRLSRVRSQSTADDVFRHDGLEVMFDRPALSDEANDCTICERSWQSSLENKGPMIGRFQVFFSCCWSLCRLPSVPLESVLRRLANHRHWMLRTGWIPAPNVLNRPGVSERSSATETSSHYEGAGEGQKRNKEKKKAVPLACVPRRVAYPRTLDAPNSFQPKEYFSIDQVFQNEAVQQKQALTAKQLLQGPKRNKEKKEPFPLEVSREEFLTTGTGCS